MHHRLDWTPQRIVAAASLLLAVVACGIVVVGASGSSRSDAADRLEPAATPAFTAVRALSDELDGIQPGASRAQASERARAAFTAVDGALERIERLDLPVAATPTLTQVVLTLESTGRWVEAVRSVLANPASQLRADLAERATAAARRAARVAAFLPAARDTIRGTGHLLSATR
jgi:hypothetical protein